MRGFGAVLTDGWRLTKPWFNSEEKWTARSLMLALVAMRLLIVGYHVIFTYWNGDFFNALQNKDSATFWALLLVGRADADSKFGFMPGWLPLTAVAIVLISYFQWLQQYTALRWRRWLTHDTVDRWMADRAYYRMGLAPAARPADADDMASQRTDNPDQRVAEDVREFASSTITLSVSFLGNIVSLASFVGILWSFSGQTTVWGVVVPGLLIWVALAYAGLGTLATHLVGRKLAPLTFQQQRVEADFRFGLVRVRENTESIAFLRGEDAEKSILGGLLAPVLRNTRAVFNRTKDLSLLTNLYDYASSIFAFVIQAPRYFAGTITLGRVTQTGSAFGNVQNSLSWFINVYPQIAEWRAIVARLTTFQAAIADRQAPDAAPAGTAPALDHVSVALPDGTVLLRDVSQAFRRGEATVIQGRSGSGKSTLLRTLSGIWPFATGRVVRADHAMFLPQRPYIPLGSLRAAITYPRDASAVPLAEVQAALRDAGLASLVPDLDATDDFARRLSGGEQQRLAVARALVAKPAWLFLDEATSSLDPAAEQEVYRTLKSKLPGTTIVSVAHRETVAALHDRRLIVENGTLADVLPQAAE